MTIIDYLRDAPTPREDDGFGALATARGNLPLHRLDVRADITGLTAGIELTQGFHNPHDVPLEATYVFPLPDRSALTRLRMTAGDRVIEGVLEERAAARRRYDEAIAAGRRASIAEEERPDVFTLRVGNILPGERVTVALTLAGPLAFADGQAEFRFPLVVAPRYIPGTPISGQPVGDGYAPDTAAVPDASRITPPVLLPGFPNPVDLSIAVRLDPAGLPCGAIASSLHAVSESEGVLRIQPGERVDRDFILRLTYDESSSALTLSPDAPADAPADRPAAGTTEAGDRGEIGDEGEIGDRGESGDRAAAGDRGEPGPDGRNRSGVRAAAGVGEGTYRLTVLPPEPSAAPRPKDLVLLLDRSGSMSGWKMVAARRAAARIVDSLTSADRFAVLAFDHRIEPVGEHPYALIAGTDRDRYRTVEHLARVRASGGTELLRPLTEGLRLLTDPSRDRVLVLVTDGQVGNEDEIIRQLGGGAGAVRIHSVGIDRAVNAGFLGRLATIGGGRCELVESEERLDEAMDRIHRRIAAPLVTGVRLHAEGLELIDGTAAPSRTPDLFPGVPLVVTGRYRGPVAGKLTVTGTGPDGGPWRVEVPATVAESPASSAIWARAHLRELEDRYTITGDGALERDIVATSLRFGVLCRFTAYVAVDPRVVAQGGGPHRVIQPVEPPSGWEGAPVPPGAGPVPPGAGPSALTLGAAAAYGSAMVSEERPLRFRAHRASRAPGSVQPPAHRPPRLPRLPGLPGQAPPSGRPVPAQTGHTRANEDAVAQVAAQEARALRSAAGEPEMRRAELLDDLASRLDAQVRWLGSGAVADALRELVAALRDAAVPLERRWDQAVATLDALAARHDQGREHGPGHEHGSGHEHGRGPEHEHGSGHEPGNGPDDGQRREAFWRPR